MAWPEAPDVQRHSYQVGYSKGLELFSQLIKGQSFLWNVQSLNISSLFSLYCIDHNGINLEINNRKIFGQSLSVWKLNNTFLKKKSKVKLESIVN